MGIKEPKVAFVGIGGYGGTVLKEIFETSTEGFSVVAAVDPYAEKSPCFDRLRRFGVPMYATMEEMFGAGCRPDLVYIATPIQFHTAQISEAVRRGANVLCEKPMTGDERDIARLEALGKGSDKFIAIGYQWSYSRAIQALKADVMKGVFGRALHLKGLVFWPRNKAYFTRSTGWAGKIYAQNGEKILDSIIHNATAHYVHNMMYVLGEKTDAAMPVRHIDATLLRTNDIETFDTATLRFVFENGATGTFVASHCTAETVEPKFEYIFEKGKVFYSEETGNILAEMEDGSVREYGDPFADGAAFKFYRCLDLILRGEKEVLCGVNAAKEEVRFVTKMHADNKIVCVNRERVRERDGFLVVDGLGEMLADCYERDKLLSEEPGFDKMTGAGKR